MFCYNFRRLLNLIGVTLFKKLIVAIKNGKLQEIREEIVRYIAILFVMYAIFLKKYTIFEIVRENR